MTPPGFRVWERAAWAALGDGTDVSPVGPVGPVGPVDAEELRSVYAPLARVIGLHIDGRAALLRSLAAARLGGGGPFVIGLAGGVSAGKSTCASMLAALLAAHGRVEVVSTDGFLLSNAALAPRGLVMRKGFPETYDWPLVERVLGGLATGTAVEVPRYSHEVYDISGPPIVLDHPDVVILEGIVALHEVIGSFCSLRLYLDAPEPDLRGWYRRRFHGLVTEARSDPGSFFSQWTGLSGGEVDALADTIWEQVNLVNLTDHILPTRWRADLVLRKGADHRVTDVAVRSR